MRGNRKLIADTFCEIYNEILPLIDAEFWDFATHDIVPGAIYIIGRRQLTDNIIKIKELVENDIIKVIFSNPAEGADTMYWQCRMLGIYNLVKQGKILLITGGYLPPDMPHLYYENFLTKILDYTENKVAIEQYKQAALESRPYKFLFLNGRMRAHRKYLLERFRASGLLNESLWTNLDPRGTSGFRLLDWYTNGDESQPQLYPPEEFTRNSFPVQRLPVEYEVDRYQAQSTIAPPDSNTDLHVKKHLFNNEWGEIYLTSAPYSDTYFSLVTETTFDYHYTFRTEKIWKPVAIGHPWIAVSNAGYYRDMHNLGFKTFGHLIDESFDSIDIPLDRAARITEVVEDLCRQDLPSFLSAADEVCKYNQRHLVGIGPEIRNNLRGRVAQFIDDNF